MNLYTNKYVHIVKCSSHFTQLQLPQLILVYILKKGDDKQIIISKRYMVPYYLSNILQNGLKVPKNLQSTGRDPTHFLSLMTTTVVSRHSYKISK